MRVMYIIKSDRESPPSPEFIAAAHKLAEREIKAGRMLDNAGLMPLAAGKQVSLKSGTKIFCRNGKAYAKSAHSLRPGPEEAIATGRRR